MEKIKIVFLVSTLADVGPIKVLYNIVRQISNDKSFIPFIITFSPEGGNSLLSKFQNLATIIQLNLSRFEGIFKLKKRVVKSLNSISPNIIHSHGFRGDLITSKILDKISAKSVSTVHNIMFDDYLYTYNKLIGKLSIYLHLKALKKIDSVTMISFEQAEYYKNLSLPIKVIHNSIDESRFNLSNLDSNREITITFAGNLSSLKDPILLIEAFIASKLVDSATLYILGDGELFEKCNKLTKNINSIKLLGRVDNVEKYFKKSDYFVSCSKSEGFGLVLAESLSCGVLPIITPLGSFKEIIKQSKLEKFVNYFSSKNELIQIFNNLTNKISLEDKKEVSKLCLSKFNSKKIGEIYKKHYNEMI